MFRSIRHCHCSEDPTPDAKNVAGSIIWRDGSGVRRLNAPRVGCRIGLLENNKTKSQHGTPWSVFNPNRNMRMTEAWLSDPQLQAESCLVGNSVSWPLDTYTYLWIHSYPFLSHIHSNIMSIPCPSLPSARRTPSHPVSCCRTLPGSDGLGAGRGRGSRGGEPGDSGGSQTIHGWNSYTIYIYILYIHNIVIRM